MNRAHQVQLLSTCYGQPPGAFSLTLAESTLISVRSTTAQSIRCYGRFSLVAGLFPLRVRWPPPHCFQRSTQLEIARSDTDPASITLQCRSDAGRAGDRGDCLALAALLVCPAASVAVSVKNIANSRKDYLNKLAYHFVTHYDQIVLENLQINGMVRNQHLAKSILDVGWGYFKQRLIDKAAEVGRQVSLVNPAYTSKTCCLCGTIFSELSRSDRWIHCACGLSIDRDMNAAGSILQRAGHALWGISTDIGLRLPQEAPPL